MKKICIISNSSYNLINFRKELIISLISKGYHVYTITPDNNYSVALSNLGCLNYILNYGSHNTNLFLNIKNFINHFKLIRKIGPKFILSFTIKPNLISFIISLISLGNYKVIATISGLGTVFIKQNMKFIFLRYLYIFLSKFSYHCFFHNEDDLKLFSKINKKVSIVPGSGIDLNKFEIVKNNNFDNKNFLFVGRLINEKGLNELIQASKMLISRNIDLSLTIIGDYDEQNPNSINSDLFYEINNSKFIKYFGFTENIKKFYQDADCVILPSYREGMPKSLLEASLSGLPILGSDVPGINNLIKNNFNGMIFNILDYKSLADTMIKFINLSIENKKLLGINGRKIIEENYSVDIVIKNYLKKINE